jgi:hypothetical protein
MYAICRLVLLRVSTFFACLSSTCHFLLTVKPFSFSLSLGLLLCALTHSPPLFFSHRSVDALKEHVSKLPESATPDNKDFEALYTFESALEARTKVPIDLASLPKGLASAAQHLPFDDTDETVDEEMVAAHAHDPTEDEVEEDELVQELRPKKKSKSATTEPHDEDAHPRVSTSSASSSSPATALRCSRRQR